MDNVVSELLKETQALIKEMYDREKAKFQATEFVGEAANGQVKVVYKNKEIVRVEIADAVKREILPDFLMAAMNACLFKARVAMEDSQAYMDNEALRITKDQTMKLILNSGQPLPDGPLGDNVISLSDKKKN